MDADQWMRIAIMAFLVAAIIGVVLYLYPRFMSGLRTEGFSTVALDSQTFPPCFARDYDAQRLLTDLYAGVKGLPPSSEAAVAYDEFKLILTKLLCLDADISSLGMGTYKTMLLPFNTHHDMEPLGSFVGRCLNNGVKERDIAITLGKLEDRGNALLAVLCGSPSELRTNATLFTTIVGRVTGLVRNTCLKERASMDIPAGPRDPGYYLPPDVQELGPYQDVAPTYRFN